MQDKILTQNILPTWLDKQRGQGGKLVFTNGCFDLLHVGHIQYLAEARKLGAALIVGVNDDASVARLKGETRPINCLQDRMLMLAALQSVDAVISFSEDDPARLIASILPDILVKGGDYTAEEVIGGKQVIAHGGEVVILEFLDGYSSTQLIDNINKRTQ